MKVQVHDGVFHGDDVVFCALIRYELENTNTGIGQLNPIRARKISDDADIVGDVGMKYDGKKFFDHHQKDAPVYENGIKYASCGLYLKHMTSLTDGEKDALLQHGLYSVQALDNGQSVDLKKYPNPFSFVINMNNNWEENIYGPSQDLAFVTAVKMAYMVLVKMINKIRTDNKAMRIVIKVAKKRENKHILVLDYFAPFEATTIALNMVNDEDERIVLAVYPNRDQWNLQTIPKEYRSFESWVNIDEDIAKKHGAKFVHRAAFLAAFPSKEKAINAAEEIVKNMD